MEKYCGIELRKGEYEAMLWEKRQDDLTFIFEGNLPFDFCLLFSNAGEIEEGGIFFLC